MDAGCEEGEVEVEMFGREHPFVVLQLLERVFRGEGETYYGY